MKQKRIDWPNIASATHGMNLNADQAAAWDQILQKAFPEIRNSEICAALSGAMEHDVKQRDPYRVTVKDLIDWIKMSRNEWREKSFVVMDTIYYPSRDRVCGQIQSGRATLQDVADHQKRNMYTLLKQEVPKAWMEK